MLQPMKIAKQIREELGVTKYRMAQLVGIMPQSYETLETKSTNMHLKHLVSLWEIARDQLGWQADKFLAYLAAEQIMIQKEKGRGGEKKK